MKITLDMTACQQKKIRDALDKENIKQNFGLIAEPLLTSQVFKVRSLDQKQYSKIYKVMEKIFN